MPLGPNDVNIDERKRAGRDASIAAKATKHKPTGQTSEDVHPFTYWWVVGYNDAVDELAGQ